MVIYATKQMGLAWLDTDAVLESRDLNEPGVFQVE